MTVPINNASARQRTGGPSPVLGRRGDGNERAGTQHLTKVEVEIAELRERSTHDLRLAWHRLHRSDPPLGLSRDLLIRVLAHQLQERTQGGASRALRRRLQNLTAGSRKAGVPRDPGIVLKTGTRLVVDDYDVDPPRRDVGEQPLQRRPLHRRTGEPAVVKSRGQAHPAFVPLAVDEGVTGFALRPQRIEFLIQPFFG